MEPSSASPATITAASRQNLGLFLGLLGVIIFAGTLPATRVAVATFDPWFLTFARALGATALAGITLAAMGRRFPIRHTAGLFYAGIALIYGFPGFMAVAMVTVPSSHGGVILGILPLLTAVFAVIIGNERPSWLFWICGITGTVLVAAYSLLQGGFELVAGDLWLLAAALTASSGYVVAGKLSARLPGWEVICWSLILCFPLSALGTALLWEPDYLSAEMPQLIALGYVTVFSMFLGFFAWNTGLNLGGLARVGQIQLFQTFFTIAFAAWLLDEVISRNTIIFACAVFLVVVISRKAQIKQGADR